MNVVTIFRYIGLAIVFLWFFGGGVGHFVNPDFFVRITPPWVPYPLEVVYISGVIEIVLALMVVFPKTRSIAGWGLIALTIAVTPANIHMYTNPELFPEASQNVYLFRLFIQCVLLLVIWWSTRVPEPVKQS
jgi:uncharacterized membrane protein